MSGFMNEWDVDNILMLAMRHKSPLEPYARYLRDWVYIVNQNSDGWNSWPGGYNAASKLCALLDRYGAIQNGYSIARATGSRRPQPSAARPWRLSNLALLGAAYRNLNSGSNTVLNEFSPFQEALAIPTVHLNGTSRTDLRAALLDARDHIFTAMNRLAQCQPHGRDYYVQQDRDAFTTAARQHAQRMHALDVVQRQLEHIIMEIDKQ